MPSLFVDTKYFFVWWLPACLLIPVGVCGFLLGLDVGHAVGAFSRSFVVWLSAFLNIVFCFCGEFDPGSG